MRIDTVYVPAGTYVLGDPCYTVPDEDWDKLLQSCDYFKRPVGISGGFEVLAFPTLYGDGVYRDQKGREFPVDAGLIGLVPVEYAQITDDKFYPTYTVEFKTLTACECRADGTLIFGDVKIETGDDSTDEFDDYEEDEE